MEEKLHIFEQYYKVDRSRRELMHGHKALCLWFTGLSGSGKSTLANMTEQELVRRGISTTILDGDNVRRGLNSDLGFSEKDRMENLRRIGEVAKLFCDSGIVTLAAFVSPFYKDRQHLRDLLGTDFIEIFVDTPLNVCEERDNKGLYKKARNGGITNFTGISSPFEAPMLPDIHIQTNLMNIEKSVGIILDNVLPKIKLEN
jgi:adenylylsulfate kinase